ncbi:hypothetical protein GUJ93_ZPchr0008g13396 [Zizania palustris]|uniref:Uncharacterized protein n=1 Tax=Zizania palustris TaxID=103762 RepID=A0A8J5R0Y5_ZIZPA|nr:hypothetical protein GUJ93_ZPchr0008g13396 [Zizania palustris]
MAAGPHSHARSAWGDGLRCCEGLCGGAQLHVAYSCAATPSLAATLDYTTTSQSSWWHPTSWPFPLASRRPSLTLWQQHNGGDISARQSFFLLPCNGLRLHPTTRSAWQPVPHAAIAAAAWQSVQWLNVILASCSVPSQQPSTRRSVAHNGSLQPHPVPGSMWQRPAALLRTRGGGLQPRPAPGSMRRWPAALPDAWQRLLQKDPDLD